MIICSHPPLLLNQTHIVLSDHVDVIPFSRFNLTDIKNIWFERISVAATVVFLRLPVADFISKGLIHLMAGRAHIVRGLSLQAFLLLLLL